MILQLVVCVASEQTHAIIADEIRITEMTTRVIITVSIFILG